MELTIGFEKSDGCVTGVAGRAYWYTGDVAVEFSVGGALGGYLEGALTREV